MLRIHCKIALCFLISLFDLSAILKIRNGEHAHYVGLAVAYTWNREKQMFVALGKEFDMQHTTFNWASMQTKSKGEFLKAGIPISKIDKLRSLLKKNGHRLTSSSNLRRYITLICKQEVERIKKELSLPGQEYMTRDVTMILNGSTRQGEAIAIIVRFIEDG